MALRPLSVLLHLRPGGHVALARACLALGCAVGAAPAMAESFSASAPVVGGDAAAASGAAFRALLWEVAMRSNAVVQSQSALINENYLEATVVRATFRLKKFQVTKEEVGADEVRLTAEVEREAVAQEGCVQAVPLQNMAYAWEGVAGAPASDALREGGAAVGEAIGQRLRETAGDYLLPADGAAGGAVYRIATALVFPADAPEGHAVLQAQIRAAGTTQRVRELRFPVEVSRWVRQEDVNLGYATLRRWVPTPAGREVVQVASDRLAEAIRCLPAVARIGNPQAASELVLSTRFAAELGLRGVALFFSAWPVGENGVVDLFRAEGYLWPSVQDERTLRFPAENQVLEKKRPAAGGYLLFQ